MQWLTKLQQWDARVSRRIALSPAAQQERGWSYWLALLGAHLGDSWLWAIIGAWEWWRSGGRVMLHNIPGISQNSRNVVDEVASPKQPMDPPRSRLIYQWFLALFIAQCANMAIKQATKRERPGTGHFLYGPGPDGYSFPSGHAMRMGVIALWGQTLWPAWGWLAWPLALWIGWSRVRLGIHYVGDVLVGLGLGGVIGRSLLVRRKAGEGGR